jgi:hypothetical protein
MKTEHAGLTKSECLLGVDVDYTNGTYQWTKEAEGGKKASGHARYKYWWKRQALSVGSDLQSGADAIQRARDSTWWNWDEGSSPFHWRWPKWYQSIIRDGLPVYFRGKKPAYKTAQRDTPDEATKVKVKEKLSAVRQRRYVQPGFVKSLTSFFSVPKGDDDVRMVYNDGTVSGLNDSIWVPRFLLPTIESHLRAVDEGMHMADVDGGECFLNFILHPEVRELAGD